jgi:hypothetical protein
MAVDVEIDVALLKSEIKKTYACVSEEPERDFIFPTGRAWAEDLGYPAELANVPDAAVESFAGVANPFSLGNSASAPGVGLCMPATPAHRSRKPATGAGSRARKHRQQNLPLRGDRWATHA